VPWQVFLFELSHLFAKEKPTSAAEDGGRNSRIDG
jgi:hypothetical protein